MAENVQVRPEIQICDNFDFDLINKRIGQLGKTCGKFDNGFYTKGELLGLPVEFLVDTGSTTTLLSCRIFNKMLDAKKPNLESTSLNIKDVNGNFIVTYGQGTMNLMFAGKVFPIHCYCM